MLTVRLEQFNSELSVFLYSISHDLRAPFRHITVYAELLRELEDDKLSDKGRRFLGVIAEAAETAGRLVDALLNLSHMGRAPLAEVEFDAVAIVAEVRRALEPLPTVGARRPTDLADLARLDRLPALLAGVLGVLAAATLVHTLVSSMRRRRRDLAILKTLGFLRRQIAVTLLWEATTLTLFALALGVPIGAAAGRWTWTLFAQRLGLVPAPVFPPEAIVVIVLGTLGLAAAVAAAPAWVAARTRPAVVLRAE